MAKRQRAEKPSRKSHWRKTRLPPTPVKGGMPAHQCVLREPLCPYIILPKRKGGVPRCRMYAVPVPGKEAGRLKQTERCYFYREWQRTGIVFTEGGEG